jgi:hypothetical protein
MSDDKRRDDTGGYGTDFGDDFGTIEFAGDDKAPSISFGDDTGPLPHWTEPPNAPDSAGQRLRRRRLVNFLQARGPAHASTRGE